jgi:flagellar protein FlaG
VRHSTAALPEEAIAAAEDRATATLRLVGQASDERAVVEAYSRFTVDPETNRVAIAIVDASTQEVIRQVPPEEIIELARLMKQQAERLGRPAPTPLPGQAGGRVVDRQV